MITLPRRKFLAGLAGIIAAPAIVRVASIMPVRSCDDFVDVEIDFSEIEGTLLQQLFDITRRAYVPGMVVDLYFEHPLLSQICA